MSASAVRQHYDVLVLGAGAAGLMCAATAGQRGRRVAVLDHARQPGRKILISGGGRCNFTHLDSDPSHFLSANPRFCISALRRYPPQEFLALVEAYRIPYTEKTPGRLFAAESSRPIRDLLVRECDQGGVDLHLRMGIHRVIATEAGYEVSLRDGRCLAASALVVATGGRSMPKMGATGLGYQLAEQFGIGVRPTRPALVPLLLDRRWQAVLGPLSGIAVPVCIATGGHSFYEDLLLTHQGVSGPAALQASLYWGPGCPVEVDWLPGYDLAVALDALRREHPKRGVRRNLEQHLPQRLARSLCRECSAQGPVGGYSQAELDALVQAFKAWSVEPAGTEGYGKAEVTAGGVDTTDVDSKTLQSRDVPGLFWAGEVLDVTGQLGGHNFQWAWASGVAAGRAV